MAKGQGLGSVTKRPPAPGQGPSTASMPHTCQANKQRGRRGSTKPGVLCSLHLLGPMQISNGCCLQAGCSHKQSQQLPWQPTSIIQGMNPKAGHGFSLTGRRVALVPKDQWLASAKSFGVAAISVFFYQQYVLLSHTHTHLQVAFLSQREICGTDTHHGKTVFIFFS